MPVIGEYRHAGIIAELPAPSHRRDERLARAQYEFEEATKRSGCRGGCACSRNRIRPGNQCFRPRFVIPRDARYLVISKVAQDDDTPVIRIPGHLICSRGDIRMEHPDFDDVIRRAGYCIPA